MMLRLRRLALIYIVSKIAITSSLTYAEKTNLGYANGGANIAANLKLGYDSSSFQESSYFYQPSFSLLKSITKGTYGLQGSYGYSLFAPEKKKDFAQSQFLDVSSYWTPTSSNTFLLSTAVKKEDEQRGTGLTADSPNIEDELDSFNYDSVKGRYAFLQSNQRGLTFSLEHALEQKKYNSNADLALNANIEQTDLTIDLGYQWSNDKKVYIESKNIKQQYPNIIDGSKDSKNKISALGFIWPLTPISNISITYGKENKKFNIGNRSLNTDYWSGLLNWSPLSHTQFTLETKSTQNPTTKIDQTLNNARNIKLEWKHTINSFHDVSFSATQTKTKEIIKNVSRIEDELLFSIINKYKDFDLTLTSKNKKSTHVNRISEFSISLGYSFKGAL